MYAQDKWHQSGGFSGHGANIACFKSFLSLSDIPLMLAAWSSVPNMVSVLYSEPLWFVLEEVDPDSESGLTE